MMYIFRYAIIVVVCAGCSDGVNSTAGADSAGPAIAKSSRLASATLKTTDLVVTKSATVGTALNVGGLFTPSGGIVGFPTTSCSTGSAMVSLGGAGTGACSPFLSTPGTGLSSSGSTINLNLTPTACSAGQAEISTAANGTSACGTFLGAAGTGLSSSGSTVNLNIVPTTCGAGQAEVSTAADGTSTCAAFGSSLTNSAGNNVITKSNGTNLVASSISDDGTNVTTAEHLIVNSDVKVTTGAGQAALLSTKRAVNTDGNNVCIGTGCQNVAYNGTNSFTGSTNVAMGMGALNANTTGYANVAIGNNAMLFNTTGNNEVAIGITALADNISGHDCVAIGNSAMAAATTAFDDVAIGAGALPVVTTGGDLVAVGRSALSTCVTCSHDTALGVGALQLSTVAFGNNVAVGEGAMDQSTTAFNSTAVGMNALFQQTTSHNDVAVGYECLQVTTTGDNNTAVGTQSGLDNTTGDLNTYLGYRIIGTTTGRANTVVGANGAVTSLPATLSNAIILQDGDSHRLYLSTLAPTSVNHGSLGTGSENTQGNVTGVGANTSVVLTFAGTPWANRSWCHAQLNTDTVAGQYIIVTNSATAPTFSCFLAGVASNCNDFSYWCTGN